MNVILGIMGQCDTKIYLIKYMEQSVRSEATVFAILGCFTGVDIRFWKALALEGRGGVRGVRLA